MKGLPRYQARTAIAQKLKELNLLRNKREHTMSIPICSRTGDVIEHLPKLQWYLIWFFFTDLFICLAIFFFFLKVYKL